MFESIAIFLIVLWLLGMTTGYTLGGLIHVFFALAILSVLFRVIQGRKILT